MFTEEEFTDLFWTLFNVLPDKVKSKTKKKWKEISDDVPFVFTDKDHIAAFKPFDYGMTNIANIAFDQAQLKDRKNSLLDVVYHEIAHCFHYADNNWLLSDYSEDPSMRKECEVKAIHLSKKWRNMINHNARGIRNDLQNNALLIRASQWYDITPLEIKTA